MALSSDSTARPRYRRKPPAQVRCAAPPVVNSLRSAELPPALLAHARLLAQKVLQGDRILGFMGRGRVDAVALAASLLAGAMVLVYLAVIRAQAGEPAAWAVVALIVGATAAFYGAVVRAPYGRQALVLAGLVLLGLGVLAILTIGLPILLAGALCWVAAARRGPVPTL